MPSKKKNNNQAGAKSKANATDSPPTKISRARVPKQKGALADPIADPDMGNNRPNDDRNRAVIFARYGMRMEKPDGETEAPLLPAQFFMFNRLHVPIHAATFAATGLRVAQLRATTAQAEFKKVFLEKKWDPQFAGICTPQLTPEVLEKHKDLSPADFAAWVSHPDQVGRLPMDVIDGAHRTEIGQESIMPEHPTVLAVVQTHNTNDLYLIGWRLLPGTLTTTASHARYTTSTTHHLTHTGYATHHRT